MVELHGGCARGVGAVVVVVVDVAMVVVEVLEVIKDESTIIVPALVVCWEAFGDVEVVVSLLIASPPFLGLGVMGE